MPSKILGLVLHPTRTPDDSLATLRSWSAGHGVELVARSVDADRAGCRGLPDAEFAATVDAVVSLGGDGTMLGALRLLADRPAPVIGVNHGHLGFLVDIQPAELPDALDRITSGAFALELRHALRVRIGDGPSAVAFNDVVVSRSPGRSAVAVDLSVSGDRYGYYRADAVVVATSTGSTAYSYAAGGPVVSPSAPVVLMTPVAPMAGISRSLVLGDTEPVGLAVTDPARIEIDGVAAVEPVRDTVVHVELQRDAGQVVRLDAARYGARSRVALSLLDLPLRPDQLLELVPPQMRALRDAERKSGPL
ncbi:NAD(+)/NADH kinase [Pseudonocardia sp. CA-107938]|uniref:NAD(+)/NADH kinase n=1 Tax=Pseudonocardia sp. CA-107938 TaxID=3240021 RepID=UPI003D92AEB8